MSTDTHPDVEAQVDTLLARRTGNERVQMMSDMFDGARALVLASIRCAHPDFSDVEVRLELFERFYGEDFSDVQRIRIRERIAAAQLLWPRAR